jgi:hypothetical protein
MPVSFELSQLGSFRFVLALAPGGAGIVGERIEFFPPAPMLILALCCPLLGGSGGRI